MRVVAREAGENAYNLRYRAADPEPVAEPEGQDFAADTSTLGRVAVGGSVTGRVADGTDDDWFAVTLEAGKTYRIEMGHNSRLDDGTNLPPRMHGIYDKDGYSVDGAFSDHSLMYFTATQDATYYVAAGTGENRPRYQKGVYELSVTEIVDDYAGDTSTTGEVAVELEAGKRYRFDLEGASTGRGTLEDPYLRGIHDADGELISGTKNDDGGSGF